MSGFRGFAFMAWQEFKYLTSRKNRASYILFLLIFGISLFGIAIQKYSAQPLQEANIPGGLTVGTAPLTDILIFMFIFGMKSLESASSGSAPQFIVPAELGLTMIIIIPILLGINMISRLAIRSAASSISREKEGKTLYIMASTPNSRSSMYLAKLAGSFLSALPMVVLMVIMVYWISGWVFSSPEMGALQPRINDMIFNTLIMTLSTVVLFTSVGTLVSVIKKEEESAVHLSGKFATLAATLTTLWILQPILEVAGEKLSYAIGTLTMVSPITLDMIVLYENDGSLLIQYAGVQLLVGVALTILGMIVFIRQDIEY